MKRPPLPASTVVLSLSGALVLLHCSQPASTYTPPGGTSGSSSSGSSAGGSGTTGGSGATATTAGTSSGGTSSGGSGTVTTGTEFCKVGGELQCERYFECDPSGSAAQFGNLAGCKAVVQTSCSMPDPCPDTFNASLASGCIAAIKAATCTELMGPAPEVCTTACE